MGPNDKIILKDSKERQGDFVFTAQNVGEYRFCFSNEGYTASDKMVDFEIAVRGHLCPDLWTSSSPLFVYLPSSAMMPNNQTQPALTRLSTTGRRRIPLRAPPPKTRHDARTDLGARRHHLQSQQPAQHHQPHAKILPHKREPEFQHRPEHGAEDLQFQSGGSRHDGRNGGFAGPGRQVLFPGREEGLRMIDFKKTSVAFSALRGVCRAVDRVPVAYQSIYIGRVGERTVGLLWFRTLLLSRPSYWVSTPSTHHITIPAVSYTFSLIQCHIFRK